MKGTTMSTLLSRRRVGRASVTAVALLGASLALLPASPAQAAQTGTINAGTAAWGISTYLNANSPGRPNPYVAGYVAPASYDATSKLTTWGNATGTVKQDGSATLDVAGSSINWANASSGHWLRLTDLRATLDSTGNGSVSAVVSYGVSSSPATFDETTVQRGPLRVDVVALAGNTAGDRTLTPTSATWTGLDGAWDPAFLTFLSGDSTADPAVPAWGYKSTVVNDPTKPDRAPSPFTFSVSTGAPQTAVTVTGADPTTGLRLKVDGTGFRGNSLPGDAGVYAGLAASGGLPDVSTSAGMDSFAASAYIPGAIPTGSFSTILTAAPTKLDRTKSYSVYTWQSHTHSNTSQDTETPVTIDWAALGLATTPPAGTTPPTSTVPPVMRSTPTVTLDWAAKPAAGRKGKLAVAVAGAAAAPTGQVTITLRREGADRVKTLRATLVSGAVLVKLPTLKQGRWTVTVAYSGSASYTSAASDLKVKVKPRK
jgi:Big-like domain-containing protein